MSFLKISAIIFFCFFNETGEFPFVSRLFKTACWSKAFVRSSRRSCDPGCGRCGLLFPKGGENFLVLGVRRDFGFEFGFEQYVTQLWALLNSYGAFLFQPSISQVRFRWQVPTSLPWAHVLLPLGAVSIRPVCATWWTVQVHVLRGICWSISPR